MEILSPPARVAHMIPKSPAPRTPAKIILLLGCLGVCFAACLPAQRVIPTPKPSPGFLAPASTRIPTALPVRPSYPPGSLVDYIAQSGDTLPGLASRFNTSIQEIRSANPIIPLDVSTLPPGFPMKIPIYYQSLWGSQYKIIPDSEFVNGPGQKNFDPVAYVNSSPGWLKNLDEFIAGRQRKGGEIIEYLSTNYSISPRVILTLLEYQAGAITKKELDPDNSYPLGIIDPNRQGLYRQVHKAVNILNYTYYGWKNGTFKSIELMNGRIERPDPWLNAATVALHGYYGPILTPKVYDQAIHSNGFVATYISLFGDPWQYPLDHIPGSLQQPPFSLPFSPGKTWTHTGGPHSAWGENTDLTAIDFAPPMAVSGCAPTSEYATAMADGIIARSDNGVVILDLDGDGDEKTGWAILYLHVAIEDRIRQGVVVKKGDPIGHPSCEGGVSTGTHIHVARKYNGEWIAADSPIPFVLDGWIVKNGLTPYEGTLGKHGKVVKACACSDKDSRIIAGME